MPKRLTIKLSNVLVDPSSNKPVRLIPKKKEEPNANRKVAYLNN